MSLLKELTVVLHFLSNDVDVRHLNRHEAVCLAETIYHEARGESTLGQVLVGEVVLNRVESGDFPATICGVVRQRHAFSWIKAGKRVTNQEQFRKASEIALKLMAGAIKRENPTAMYFINPQFAQRRPWMDNTKIVKFEGDHVFLATYKRRK